MGLDFNQRLSPNFQLKEFITSQTAARKGIDNTPPDSVVYHLRVVASWLEMARKILGHPITISSGYRSPALNKAVGGARNSAHLSGFAADFECPGFGSPEAVFRRLILAGLPCDQLILEFPPEGWVHVGLSIGPGRQQHLIIDSNGTRSA